MEFVESRLKKVIIWFVLQYQRWVSQAFLPRCRFYPSCSNYALEALRDNKLLIALGMIFNRLIRCRPGGDYGVDFPGVDKREVK